MANMYDAGNADARQTDNEEVQPEHSLFRKRYRKMTDEELALNDAIKDKADELAALFYEVAPINKVHVPDRERVQMFSWQSVILKMECIAQ